MSPLHPLFVHFPIALFTVSIAADILARVRESATASMLGFWCLSLAVVGALAAVLAGFSDMYRADLFEDTHRFVHLHRNVGLTLLAAFMLLGVWRWRMQRDAAVARRTGWPYLLSAMVVFSLLAFQGWFGHQLVYGLGAGVAAAGQGVVRPEEGARRLAPFSIFTEAPDDHHGHAH